MYKVALLPGSGLSNTARSRPIPITSMPREELPHLYKELGPNSKSKQQNRNFIFRLFDEKLTQNFQYDGYVPGSRFRYGGRYGHLTYNAKEIDVPASKTWGGNTSINIGSGK